MRRSDHATPASTGAASARRAWIASSIKANLAGQSGTSPTCCTKVTPEPAQHVVDRHRLIGQLAHRHPDQPPSTKRCQVDLQTTRRSAVSYQYRPIGDAGDEGPEPQWHGVLAVGDRPSRIEVDDDTNVQGSSRNATGTAARSSYPS
jgi:hypothetical protein